MRLEDVSANYDRASGYYDALTDVVFGRFLGLERYREHAVDLLGDLSGARVLDLGCGTGRNFPLLAPRLGASGYLVGLDYSRGMLDQARRRVREDGWDRVGLVRGDAARLDGLRQGFDAVASVWCLGIVHDLESALSGALDLLRPGGRIAIVDFRRSRPDRGVMRWAYPLYSRLLRMAGIDSAEDLDDARLRERWRRGLGILRERLTAVREESYLRDTGLIVAGTAVPLRTDVGATMGRRARAQGPLEGRSDMKFLPKRTCWTLLAAVLLSSAPAAGQQPAPADSLTARIGELRGRLEDLTGHVRKMRKAVRNDPSLASQMGSPPELDRVLSTGRLLTAVAMQLEAATRQIDASLGAAGDTLDVSVLESYRRLRPAVAEVVEAMSGVAERYDSLRKSLHEQVGG